MIDVMNHDALEAELNQMRDESINAEFRGIKEDVRSIAHNSSNSHAALCREVTLWKTVAHDLYEALAQIKERIKINEEKVNKAMESYEAL